ncbi:cystein proteinase inhibitor protein salarin-like [Boleophthalmus pectinirostris]|uniref:cystein proteinase inhibitor protein salarin-like n=1 Tax=Boleophthalmus pectinirostris TaxID=150288 RepID=UPI0024328A9D|nr:cystein proteinase inhibitor protein salarin-like [Boleophthalmus pectinirostris]
MLLVHLCTLLLISSALSVSAEDRDLDKEFEEWKTKYNKVYSSPEEEVKRRAIWEETLKGVEAHNKAADEGVHSYRLSMNQFSDLTLQEIPTGLVSSPDDSTSLNTTSLNTTSTSLNDTSLNSTSLNDTSLNSTSTSLKRPQPERPQPERPQHSVCVLGHYPVGRRMTYD